MSAIDPVFRPRYLLSAACAASSTIGIPRASSGSRSAGCPARSTGRTAFVRSVTAAATSAGSMLRSSSSTSTKTGVAPVCTITFAVAGQVIGDVITSSPGPIPRATSARCSAAVPEARASTCSASRYSAMRSSSLAALGPVVSQPERRVSATAAISSSPIAGGWNPSMVSRLDESFDIDLEPNHGLRAVGAFERLLAAVPDREHRAGSVGASAELAEAVAGTPVDADAADPVQRECLLYARDVLQFALRSDQEPDAGPAHLRRGRQRSLRDLLAERGAEGSPVQVDAERDPAELGVVPAAKAGGELADTSAVGPDEDLRVARAVLDTHCPCRLGGRLHGLADLGRLELARPDMCQRDAE